MIALITYAKFPALTDDDRPLIEALGALGMEAWPVRWDESGVNWSDYDAVVLRSCWDYHLRAGEFRRWLGVLERLRVPVWNPVPLVRWNMHKSYLRDLEAAGVTIPRTRWVEQGERVTLSGIMREERWTEAIVKPAISASATDTFRAAARVRADASRFTELVARADVLVQEYVAEVQTQGEWSLVFLGGEFSHAMLKRPSPGDFRVQTELGGSATRAEAPAAVVEAASAVMAAVPFPWLFARVDGVEGARGFVVMEVECIEPLLFLLDAPGAHDRFARALQRALGEVAKGDDVARPRLST